MLMSESNHFYVFKIVALVRRRKVLYFLKHVSTISAPIIHYFWSFQATIKSKKRSQLDGLKKNDCQIR